MFQFSVVVNTALLLSRLLWRSFSSPVTIITSSIQIQIYSGFNHCDSPDGPSAVLSPHVWAPWLCKGSSVMGMSNMTFTLPSALLLSGLQPLFSFRVEGQSALFKVTPSLTVLVLDFNPEPWVAR
jgi:hypothetical protein